MSSASRDHEPSVTSVASGFAWTSGAQDYLEEMARDGMTGGQIAKALGVTRNAVIGRCNRTGVKLGADRKPDQKRKFCGRPGRPPMPDAVKLLAMAAHFAGMSVRKAAAEAGVSHVSLHKWLCNEPALAARARGIAFTARYAVGASTVEQPRKAKATRHKADPATGKQHRGFAAMSPEKRRAIAAKGGAAVSKDKRSFSKNRDLAALAGRAGGLRKPVGHGFA